MQKKITAQTVIEYVYMLFRKRRALDEDIRREVNKLIVKCNAHLCSEGDKYLSDPLKEIETEEDYECWMKVFRKAKESVLLLRSNGQISEELFDAVLQRENYIYGSMNKFLSPSRYYERERRVFHAVVKYLYYYRLVLVE